MHCKKNFPPCSHSKTRKNQNRKVALSADFPELFRTDRATLRPPLRANLGNPDGPDPGGNHSDPTGKPLGRNHGTPAILGHSKSCAICSAFSVRLRKFPRQCLPCFETTQMKEEQKGRQPYHKTQPEEIREKPRNAPGMDKKTNQRTTPKIAKLRKKTARICSTFALDFLIDAESLQLVL